MDTTSKETEKLEKNRNSIMQAPQPHGMINQQDADFGEDGDEGEEEDAYGQEYYGSGQNTEGEDGRVFNQQHDMMAGGGTF